MKYYLKIGSTVFNNVSELTVSGKYRMENVQKNIAGDYLVDRIGSEKITITAKLNLLTLSEINTLIAARNAISADFTFDRGNTRLTKTMRLAEFTEPSPIYLYGDKSKGIRYGSITIQAEEM